MHFDPFHSLRRALLLAALCLLAAPAARAAEAVRWTDITLLDAAR